MGKRKFKTWKAERAYAEVLNGEHPWDQGGEVHLAIADATAALVPVPPETETIQEPPPPAPAPPPDPIPTTRQSKRITGE